MYSLLLARKDGIMITLENVTCTYENTIALDDISLHITAGETIYITGPNGSGKSTLFKLLNGLIFPINGIYTFNGTAITAKQLKDVRFAKSFHQKMGYVFQNPDVQLFCGTVYDEIAFGPRQMGLVPDEVDSRVQYCLDMLHLKQLAERPPYQLSGGEKKKTAIAAVLALNPDVLMLDEPFNGLDKETRQWLCNFLVSLHQAGKTIITATHETTLQEILPGRTVRFTSEHTLESEG
jgi:cobalt/nickel transport system ATP-binding protein